MKTLLHPNAPAVGALWKSFVLVLLLSACAENEVNPLPPAESPVSPDKELNDAQGRKSCLPEGPNYNLNVLLRGDEHPSAGFIKFRQYENETQLIHLDTWVFGLEPNTSYILQRAVDTTLDLNCTGNAWLTLGKGMVPQSIVTNNGGQGRAELFRSVAAIPVGTTFDIHFQILKESDLSVVLSSDCYQYTVR